MQAKLIANLKRYSKIAVWSDLGNIDTISNELKDHGICTFFLPDSQLKDQSSYAEAVGEAERNGCSCLLADASENGYMITQRLKMSAGDRLIVINMNSYDDFYEKQHGIISKFVRSKRDEDTVYSNSFKNQNIKKVYEYAGALFESTPLFKTIEIETFNRCNGTCSFCPANVHNDTRVPEKMRESLLRKIIADLQTLNYSGRVSLYSNNEPFLDDRIIAFSELLYKSLPYAKIHMFTNGSLLNEEKLISIIPFVDELIIDNYSSDFTLLPNIQKIYDKYKDAAFLKRVKIVLRLQNEVLSTRGGYAPNRTLFPDFSMERCVLPFVQMVVRPNGTVGLCCNAPLSDTVLGDLNDESLLDVWYGSKYRALREKIVRGRLYVESCKTCDAFQYY